MFELVNEDLLKLKCKNMNEEMPKQEAIKYEKWQDVPLNLSDERKTELNGLMNQSMYEIGAIRKMFFDEGKLNAEGKLKYPQEDIDRLRVLVDNFADERDADVRKKIAVEIIAVLEK